MQSAKEYQVYVHYTLILGNSGEDVVNKEEKFSVWATDDEEAALEAILRATEIFNFTSFMVDKIERMFGEAIPYGLYYVINEDDPDEYLEVIVESG